MMTANVPHSNVKRQLTHQRKRRKEGDRRVFYWQSAETREVYDRLRKVYGGRVEDMMAAALRALDATLPDLGNSAV